jgi:hypothetical protein
MSARGRRTRTTQRQSRSQPVRSSRRLAGGDPSPPADGFGLFFDDQELVGPVIEAAELGGSTDVAEVTRQGKFF